MTFVDAPFLEISPTHRVNTKISFKEGEPITVTNNQENIDTPISRFNKIQLCEYITDNGNVTDKLKIKCARKHFEALGEEVAFMAPESSPDEFMEKARAAMADV